jgi:hypothetical protein
MSKPNEEMVACCPECGSSSVFRFRETLEEWQYEVSLTDGVLRERQRPCHRDCNESYICCHECEWQGYEESELIVKPASEATRQD